MESRAMLGRDHSVYGDYDCEEIAEGRVVGAISVGAAPFGPSMMAKGDPENPNEDALFMAESDGRILLAVADAHFGGESSHELIEAVAKRTTSIPQDPDELEDLVASLGAPGSRTGSETTFLIAVLHETAALGFGLAYGDSALAVVQPDGARLASPPRGGFVTPRDPSSLAVENASPFRFLWPPDALVLAFTDGIHECHYRSPRTSVGPRHLDQLYRQVGAHPRRYAVRLMEMALRGVDGNPGGQDNVALVVCRPA